VPFSCHAFGATSFDKAIVPDAVEPDRYDLIIVEDRDKALRVHASLKATNKLCNVSWLKQCIVRCNADHSD